MVTYDQIRVAAPPDQVQLLTRAYYTTGQLVAADWPFAWIGTRHITEDRSARDLPGLAAIPAEYGAIVGIHILPTLSNPELMQFYITRLMYQLKISRDCRHLGLSRHFQGYSIPASMRRPMGTWKEIFADTNWFNALAYCHLRFTRLSNILHNRAQDAGLIGLIRNLDTYLRTPNVGQVVPYNLLYYIVTLMSNYLVNGVPEITDKDFGVELFQAVPEKVGFEQWRPADINAMTIDNLGKLVSGYAARPPTDAEIMRRLHDSV